MQRKNKPLPKMLVPVVSALRDTNRRRQYAKEASELRSYTDGLADRWGLGQEEVLGLFSQHVARSPLPWQECKRSFELENLWRGDHGKRKDSGGSGP